MGVVKNQNKKNRETVNKDLNGKIKKDDEKVKKKKKVSCLQCLKSPDDGGLEGKYRVAAPELMQDTFMSDSEDEGGEVECPIQQQQQYRYMNSEAGTLQRARPLEDSVTDGHRWPSNNDSRVATIERQPLDIGFLVSFVVDARGGAMKAKRRGGVRIIVPPAACAAPTRVTCRAATRRAPAAAPPPLMEGEALASRLLELQPQGAKFLAPVIIEVPIFTASCPEREIVILRSDTGDTWQDHYLHNNDNAMIQEVLSRERAEFGNTGEALGESGERVTRVVTCDFPHYLAVVSRVRQEVHAIGPEGGTVSSAHIPQVQAQFPAAALTKRIRVGLQAHGARAELARRVLPRRAAVSPVLTVEPRRRKFHRSITLTVPLPQHPDDKVNPHDKQWTANLRLLCSIMGGQARAVWEDVTGSTPLTVTDDCASFTTTVSARFWLMNCQNVSDATKLATELYREMLLVPFEVRIVVLGKRLDALEGRLLVLYIADRYAYDTLLQQEHYTEVAHSTAVRLLDGKDVYLEFSGNLVPVTKSGSQPTLTFEAFKDNRVEFTVRVKHHEESPSGRIYFMNEPKVAKGEPAPSPACVLDVQLPAAVAPRPAKSHVDCLNLDQSGFDALKDELSFHWGDHNNSLGPASLPQTNGGLHLNGHDKTISNGDVKYTPAEENNGDSKQHVNGDTLHVDSNKTKATFDSDEDKTPMNTLEKGKKKSEGGSFLGGLADKVKNVFSHSEDKEDIKESSPQPQPKPRESKDKTPPKPASRVINEDLLEKVDDMFKDLHSKPHLKEDDDLNNQVYSTKLIVDEEETPKKLKLQTEDVYHQYEHMQPVDTPLCCKTSDPFVYYTGCCEERFKKGEKHRHDETSTLADRIEQVEFTAKEKIQEISDRVENEVEANLDKLNKERDNIYEKTNDVKDDLVDQSNKIKNDLVDKEKELKSIVHDIKDDVNTEVSDGSKTVQNVYDNSNAEASDIGSHVTSEIENIRSSADKTIHDLTESIGNTQDKAKVKFDEFDFQAREKAEELKNRGNDKILLFESSLESSADNIKQKAHDVQEALQNKTQGLNNTNTIDKDLNKKTQQVKASIDENVKNIKDSVNGKINNAQSDLINKTNDVKSAVGDKTKLVCSEAEDRAEEINDSIDTVKEKGKKVVSDTKSKAKKKSKEGKNFFTGLVHNIFGEKEKLEEDLKEKMVEGKEAANNVVNETSLIKDGIKETVATKQAELQDTAGHIVESVNEKRDCLIDSVNQEATETVQNIEGKKQDISKAIQEKKNEIQESVDEIDREINEKTDLAKQTVQDTIESAEKAVQNKKVKLVETQDAVMAEADERLERIRHEAEQTTDDIKRTAEETLNAALLKKSEVQTNISDKCSKVKESGKEEIERVQMVLSDKSDNLQQSVQQAYDNAHDTTSSAFDNIESVAKDNVSDAKDTWEVLQSSTRDTFADMKDDVHGLESSAQDTLHSFQSSAGNTFDSLDDSAREYIGGFQNTASNVQEESKVLFSNVKDSFEGFQIAAGDKLEDIKGSANDSVHEAGKRLEATEDTVKSGVRNAEEAVTDALASETDKFTSNLNDLGNSVFGNSGKGFMKDSSTKLLESEKSQSSPHKKSSGIPKLKRKK